MSTALADVFVRGRIDTSGFGSDIRRGVDHTSVKSGVADAGKKAGRGYTSAFGSALKIGASIAAGFAVVKGVDFFKGAIADAQAAEKATALTNQVIKTTGGVAGVTAKQVSELTDKISLKTGIDHAAVQSGSNLLLTFKNIRNETGQGNKIFDQATQSVTDMSVALNQPLKSGAIQLGKALNDPVKGITALSRVGVSFTDQQKKQIAGFIKSGNVMKAQKVILTELKSEFGGAAAAAATPAEKAAVAWTKFKETIGTALLPTLYTLETAFTTKVIPALYKVGGFIQADVIPALKVLGKFVSDNSDLIKPLAIGLGVVALAFGVAAVATAAWTAVLAVNPITVAVIAIELLTAAVIVAYKRSDTFRAIVDHAFTVAKEAGVAAWKVLQPVLASMVKGFESVVGFIHDHWGDISAVVKRVFSAVVDYLRGAFLIIQGIFKTAVGILTGDWSGAWDGMKLIVRGAWTEIKSVLSLGVDAAKAILSRAWDAIKAGTGKAWGGIVGAVKSAWDNLKKAVGSPIYFVLQAVINDKLIAGFNKLLGLVHLPNIPDIPTGGIPHFARGGFTGEGGKYDPAGIVHRGEFVFDKETTRKHRGVFEAIHRGKIRGYASGGIVTMDGEPLDVVSAAQIRIAEKLAKQNIYVIQGSFQPATSYSGTTHTGAGAADVGPITSTIVKAMQLAGFAAWDRTGRGNWAPHIHAVSEAASGLASSAASQVQDFIHGTGDGLGGPAYGPHLQPLPNLASLILDAIGAGFQSMNLGPLGQLAGFSKAIISALANPKKFLEDKIAGPLSQVASGPIGDVVKALPGKVISGMVDVIKNKAGSAFGTSIRPLATNGAGVVPRDTGGLLHPGVTKVLNGTGQNEAVLSPADTKSFRALAAAATKFKVSPGDTASVTRGVFTHLLDALRKAVGAGSPLVERVRDLGNKLVSTQKSQDKLAAQYGKAQSQLKSTLAAQHQEAQTIAGAFTHDAFGGTLKQAELQLRADRNDATRARHQINRAAKHGLSRAAIRYLSESGNTGLIGEVGHLNRREIDHFNNLIRARSRETGHLGQAAASREFADQRREEHKDIQQLVKALHHSAEEIRHIGRRVERGARDGVHGNARASAAVRQARR